MICLENLINEILKVPYKRFKNTMISYACDWSSLFFFTGPEKPLNSYICSRRLKVLRKNYSGVSWDSVPGSSATKPTAMLGSAQPTEVHLLRGDFLIAAIFQGLLFFYPSMKS